MIQLKHLPFSQEYALSNIPVQTTPQGDALLQEQGQKPLFGQVFSQEDTLFFQWEHHSIPMYSPHFLEISLHLTQGYGVFAQIFPRGKSYSSDLYFFQELSPVGNWEIQLKEGEKAQIATLCNVTSAVLRDPSHHLQFRLSNTTQGFSYSLGYYPTVAEENEGYERSSQPTFRIYGEKYWLLLRVMEDSHCLRVVRVETPKDTELPPFSLAIGTLQCVPHSTIAPDSALRLLQEREGAQYIQLWDSYAQAEGDMLLAKIRAVGEIVFSQSPSCRITERGTFEYVGKLKDPEQGDRFRQIKETQGTLLLSTALPHHLDSSVSWTEYSQRRRQTQLSQHLSTQFHGKKRPKQPNTTQQEMPPPLPSSPVEQRCQFTLHPWNNTLIMHHDQKTMLHFGFYPTESTPEEEQQRKELESDEGHDLLPKELPKVFVTLDLGGDATRIKRRNQARNRMLDGASANPRMSKVMEGRQTTQGTAQEILDPLTLDHVMAQCFPYGATPSQREAVNLALNTPDIALIQGPPGTGKTTVITAVIEGIHQELSQEQRKPGEILITSYQHDAVDHVQKQILTGSIPPVKFEGKERSQEKSAVDLWCDQWKERFVSTHSALEPSILLEQLQDRYHHYQNKPTQEEGRLFLEFASSYSKDPTLQGRIKDLLSQSPPQEDSAFLLSRIRKLRTTKQGFLDDGPQRASDVIYGLCGDFTSEKGKARQEQAKKKFPVLFQALTMTPTALTASFLADCSKEKQRLLEASFLPPSLHSINPEITDVFSLLQREWNQYDENTSSAKETLIFKDLLYEINHQSPNALRNMMSKYALVYGATLQHSVASPLATAKLGTARNKGQDRSISFDTVIVDEAARANPMDLMIAITQGKRRLILVGDHRQLPQVYDEELLEHLQENSGISLGLEQSKESMFQYLMAMAKKLEGLDGIARTLTLKEQFRMHPLLGNFVNAQFYQAHSMEESFSSPLPSSHFTQTLEPVPLVWMDVPLPQGGTAHGSAQGQTRSHNSLKRDLEAQCIADTLCTYLEKEGASHYTYGIITFYNGQKLEILSRLEEKKRAFPALSPLLDLVEVGTVDSFQGKEFDVMFLSLVRSRPPKPPKTSKPPQPSKPPQLSSDKIENEPIPLTEVTAESAVPSKTLDTPPKETQLEKQGRRTYGFMTMENRLCVALSRQKRLLVVVGNSSIYGSDPQWRELASTCVPSLYALYQLSNTEGTVRLFGRHASST